MDRIDIYNNSECILQNKSNNYFVLCSYIIFILLVLFAWVCVFYEYDKYLIIKSVVVGNKDSYFLKLIIKDDDLNLLNDNLYVNDKKHEYDILEIGDYIYDQNYNKYREIMVVLNIDDSSVIINNNILDVVLRLPETTLYEEFIKKWKEGLN